MGDYSAIGIWQPEINSGEVLFIRDSHNDVEHLWSSDCDVLKPDKGRHKRICLIGESVAAGYYYAPYITPAKLLQYQLNVCDSDMEIEVVDLCKVDMDALELVETCLSSLQLQPDIMVVFAGNNWPQNLATLGPDYLAQNNSNEFSVSEIWSYFISQVEQLTDAVIEDLISIRHKGQCRLIFVLPEVNLCDWVRTVPVCWLEEDGLSQWYRLRAEAMTALKDKYFGLAENMAREMLELDQGFCAETHRLLGEICRQTNQPDDAITHFRNGVDQRSWVPLHSLPGVVTPLIDRIRDWARGGEFELIDLPEVLGKESEIDIPGSQYFVDYCHLTIQGMQRIVSEITNTILYRDTALAFETFDPQSLGIDSSMLSRLSFLGNIAAAVYLVYNSDIGESPILESKIEELEQHLVQLPDGLELLKLYLDVCLEGPRFDGLTDVAMQLYSRCGRSTTGRLVAMHSASHLNFPIIESFSRLIEDKEYLERYTERLIENYSCENKPVDLLDPKYSLNQLHELKNLPKSLIHHAIFCVSNFVFVASGNNYLEIRLNLRLPQAVKEMTGLVNLSINSNKVKTITVGNDWVEQHIYIRETLILRGLNKLSIDWPFPAVNSFPNRPRRNQFVKTGLPIELYPVFGKIRILQIYEEPGKEKEARAC